MSWGVKIAGQPSAIAVEVAKDTNIPETVKADIAQALALVKPLPGVTFVLDSNGHLDSYGGSATFSITQAREALLPTDPSAAPAAPPAA